MKKMKLAAALFILLATGAVAQTTTTYQTVQANLKIHVPCAVNAGRGEDITFTGRVYQVTKITKINGKSSGVIFWNTRDLIGKGATTGVTYTQVGSWQQIFSGVDLQGDGDYLVVTTFSLGGAGVNVIFRNATESLYTNNGNTLAFPLGLAGDTTCK